MRLKTEFGEARDVLRFGVEASDVAHASELMLKVLVLAPVMATEVMDRGAVPGLDQLVLSE